MNGNWTSSLNSVAFTAEPIEKAHNRNESRCYGHRRKMTPKGYVYARFYFGQSYVDLKLVIFIDIKTPLLCIDIAKKLNIVYINNKGSIEHPEFKPKKCAAETITNEHYFSPIVLDVVQSIQANDAHLFSNFDA